MIVRHDASLWRFSACQLARSPSRTSSVTPRQRIVTSGDMKDTQKCKMQQLSADRLQLNREVDYHLCQFSGVRK